MQVHGSMQAKDVATKVKEIKEEKENEELAREATKKKKRKRKREKMIVCSCHVTYAFQSESSLYICLNVKELLA